MKYEYTLYLILVLFLYYSVDMILYYIIIYYYCMNTHSCRIYTEWTQRGKTQYRTETDRVECPSTENVNYRVFNVIEVFCR